MEFHIDFKKDFSAVLEDAAASGFSRPLASMLYAAAPDGTRSITLRAERVGKHLYNGSVHFCDIKGIGYSKSLGNCLSIETPELKLAELVMELMAPEAEERGTPG